MGCAPVGQGAQQALPAGALGNVTGHLPPPCAQVQIRKEHIDRHTHRPGVPKMSVAVQPDRADRLRHPVCQACGVPCPVFQFGYVGDAAHLHQAGPAAAEGAAVDLVAPAGTVDRFYEPGLIGFHILFAQNPPVLLDMRSNPIGNLALVKRIHTLFGDLLQQFAQIGILGPIPRGGKGVAVQHQARRLWKHSDPPLVLLHSVHVLRRGPKTVPTGANGRRQCIGQRKRTKPLQGQGQPCQHARHRDGPVPDLVRPVFHHGPPAPIRTDHLVHRCGGRLGSNRIEIDTPHLAIHVKEHHPAVARYAVSVRSHHTREQGGRHRCIDGVSALFQHTDPCCIRLRLPYNGSIFKCR